MLVAATAGTARAEEARPRKVRAMAVNCILADLGGGNWWIVVRDLEKEVGLRRLALRSVESLSARVMLQSGKEEDNCFILIFLTRTVFCLVVTFLPWSL